MKISDKTTAVLEDIERRLAPETEDDFIKQWEDFLYDRFDGGAMHFCGRGDHYIETLCSIPKLYGINLGQPLHNDMEKIFANSVDKGIKVLGFSKTILTQLEKREKGYNQSLHVR